ncbi:MAG: hypothetical protein ACRD9L_28765, partial [Bryobacteraceae bacterium]
GALVAPRAERPLELLEAAVSAAANGDTARAIEKLTEFAALNPFRVESLRSEPNLAPIRADVERLVSRLTSIAKLDAGTRLEHATQLTETAGADALPDWDAKPGAVLQIAARLFESGGHDNYVRAAQVAQVLIDVYETAPVANPLPSTGRSGRRIGPRAGTASRFLWPGWAAARRQAAPQIRKLWLRAPLLVLLLGWFSAGLASGVALLFLRAITTDGFPPQISSIGFDIWGIGLLALVGFGFYMRVRNVRS